jgi:Leu/Phe-tRNA-protein transferase
MKKMLLVLTLLIIFPVSFALGIEIGGVQLPDSLTVNNTKLQLNGAGLRTKVVIKVYAGGLYLLQKETDPTKIITADEPMVIRMHFIHSKVSKESLINAWNEGFANATNGNIAAIEKEIKEFNGYFQEDAKKGDIYDVIYLPGQGVSVEIKGKQKGPIPGLEFKKAVFGIWLGEKPADAKLKKGILGM